MVEFLSFLVDNWMLIPGVIILFGLAVMLSNIVDEENEAIDRKVKRDIDEMMGRR